MVSWCVDEGSDSDLSTAVKALCMWIAFWNGFLVLSQSSNSSSRCCRNCSRISSMRFRSAWPMSSPSALQTGNEMYRWPSGKNAAFPSFRRYVQGTSKPQIKLPAGLLSLHTISQVGCFNSTFFVPVRVMNDPCCVTVRRRWPDDRLDLAPPAPGRITCSSEIVSDPNFNSMPWMTRCVCLSLLWRWFSSSPISKLTRMVTRFCLSVRSRRSGRTSILGDDSKNPFRNAVDTEGIINTRTIWSRERDVFMLYVVEKRLLKISNDTWRRKRRRRMKSSVKEKRCQRWAQRSLSTDETLQPPYRSVREIHTLRKELRFC